MLKLLLLKLLIVGSVEVDLVSTIKAVNQLILLVH